MNLLFPGRPDYQGPTKGFFGLLHHDKLFEHSHNVLKRVEYVKNEKPKNKIAIRLHNMIYLGDDYNSKLKSLDDNYYAKLKSFQNDYNSKLKSLDDDYDAKLKSLDDDYDAKLKPLDDDYYAKLKPLDDKVLKYIKQHIPNCAWNENRK